MIIPTKEGDNAAQEIYDCKTAPTIRLGQLACDLTDYFSYADPQTGIPNYDHQKMEYMVARGVWRANLAPVLHAIDIHLEQQLRDMRERGKTLAVPESADLQPIDKVIGQYGKYTGRWLAFLRTAGWYAWRAAEDFLHTVQKENNWCAPILEEYKKSYPNYLKRIEKPKLASYTHLLHVKEISVAANITSLDALYPAMTHASLWAHSSSETTWEILQRQANELSWPQYLGADFFERHFTDLAEGGIVSACPVNHNYGSEEPALWRSTSLRKKRVVPHYCPAAVDLLSPLYPEYGIVSAATLRTATNIYIAEGIFGA